MSDELIDDIADAVVTQLNAETWTPTEFDAFVTDVALWELPALAALQVSVMPTNPEFEIKLRGFEEASYVLELGWQQLGPDHTADGVDPIIAWSRAKREEFQTVAKWLRQKDNRRPIAERPNLILRRAAFRPLYDANILKKQRRYIGICELTYVDMEAING